MHEYSANHNHVFHSMQLYLLSKSDFKMVATKFEMITFLLPYVRQRIISYSVTAALRFYYIKSYPSGRERRKLVYSIHIHSVWNNIDKIHKYLYILPKVIGRVNRVSCRQAKPGNLKSPSNHRGRVEKRIHEARGIRSNNLKKLLEFAVPFKAWNYVANRPVSNIIAGR